MSADTQPDQGVGDEYAGLVVARLRAENERLRALIAKAPHDRDCEAGYSFWPGPCLCWKTEVSS